MATDGVSEAADSTFPAVDVDRELNPGRCGKTKTRRQAFPLKKMATDGVSEAADSTFPAVDVDRELNPGKNKDFKVDPISSEVATSLEIKQRVEAEDKAKEREKKDALQTLKTTIIVSGVILAVAGAVIAITKKLREK